VVYLKPKQLIIKDCARRFVLKLYRHEAVSDGEDSHSGQGIGQAMYLLSPQAGSGDSSGVQAVIWVAEPARLGLVVC